MARDRRLRHRERRRDLGNGPIPARETGKDRAARGIREGPEDGVEIGRLHIDNPYVMEQCGY